MGVNLKEENVPEAAFEVQINEEFVITLDSNPTTGYRWEPEFDETIIRLQRREFKPSSKKIGTGGTEKFQFVGVKIGETNIKMSCKRAWEDKAIEEKCFWIKIK